MNLNRTAAAAALALALLAPLPQAQTPCAWQAENRNLMVEIENVPPAGNWIVQTTYPGYAGESYYRWNGPNHFNQPGNGVLTYEIEVHVEGRYELRIHNRHEHPDSTLENDCWVRMDGGPWIKLYSNGSGTVAQWNWKSRFEIGSAHSDAGWDLTVGRHTFEISGRSWGFQIDRFNFFMWNAPGSQNVNTPESICGLGGNFCESTPNSSGFAARIEALGSISIADNALELMVRPVPVGQAGIIFYGENEADVPFGNGTRCVGNGLVYRLPPTTTTPGGALRVTADLSSPPLPSGQILPGTTWHFQGWFRDPAAGGAGFDLSNGLHINFLP